MEKYNTIYVDPPWEVGKTSLDRLLDLPTRDLCQPNALLLLWFPAAELPGYLGVLGAWGFDYLQLWTWICREGMVGHWTRKRAEHLLLGVKGTVQVDYLLRQNVFNGGIIDGGHHPAYFKELAEQAAMRAFTPPVMLDAFGAYWHQRDPLYLRDDWDWWDGLKIG